MDPFSARSQLQHDLLKHASTGEQHLESNKDRSLCDSKLQHSNLSPEAASRHGSSFHYIQSVAKPNKITSKEKMSQAEHRQNYKAHHKQCPVESKSSSKVTKPPYAVSYTKVTKEGCDEYHDNEEASSSLSDPDYFSLAHKFNRHEAISGSHHHVKHGKVHVNDAVSKKTIAHSQSSRHKESYPSQFQTQKSMPIPIVSEATNSSGVQATFSPLSLSEPPLSIAAVGGESNVPQSVKHHFGDSRKGSNQFCQHLLTHDDDFNSEKTRSKFTNHHAASSSLPRQESEISTNLFTKYKTDSSRVECSSYQGNASMPLSLHLSLSDISRESHGRMTKSTRDLRAVRLSFEHLFEPENVKTKVKSVWNNIRFGWTFKSKSSFKYDSPLFMLGKCYHRRKDDPNTEPEDQFLQDFVSRIWLTYRSNFYPIPGTKLSTDCGWGCMLRSGQMLIAQCLVTHFLGRDWRLYNKQTDTESVFYREIIRWFSDPLDVPSDKTPFCLHHLTNFGRAYDKDPGNWYGPASVAYIFRDTFIKASHSVPVLSQLCLYVAQDCTVYIEDVNHLCSKKHRSGSSVSSSSECDAGTSRLSQKMQNEKWLRSVIILIPMRLGGEVTNEIYAPCVQSLLSHDNCMGIIGGRPKHSLYFLGWQDSKLIYLDPHLCREAVDTTVPDFKIETFHCMTPRKLAIRKMDPSCAVGFYIKDADDFKHFIQEVKEFISPPKQKGIYPLFTFSNGRQCESTFNQTQSTKDKRVRVTHYYVDQYGQKTVSGESEEFVML